MNILYIEHYAGSNDYGMEFRPYYFARNWVKWGHKVIMVAADYHHLRVKNPVVSKDFEEEDIDGITYVWVKTNQYTGNGFGRVRNVEMFLRKLWNHSDMLVKKYQPDVIISSSTYPMDTYPSQRMAKKCGAVLIHEVHDMWPISPMELYGLKASNPIIKYIQAAENSFCKYADAIVSIQPCAEEYYLEHGMPKGHFYHVPNGVVTSEWDESLELPQEYQDIVDEIRQKYKRVLCFFGSHTKSYAIDYLLNAADKCRDISVGYLLVGDGNIKDKLIAQAEELKLESVRFMKPIPKKYIPPLLAQVDGIYVGALHNKMFVYGSCMNKTYDAMMSGKPIIFANPAPNNYILDYDCGYNAIPENVNDLERCIREFSEASDQELAEKGSRGKQAILDHFDYDVLSKDFENIMLEVLNKKQKGKAND